MFTREDLDLLTEEELSELEKTVNMEIAAWKVANLRGQAAIFHDDQHIGEKRRELADQGRSEGSKERSEEGRERSQGSRDGKVNLRLL